MKKNIYLHTYNRKGQGTSLYYYHDFYYRTDFLTEAAERQGVKNIDKYDVLYMVAHPHYSYVIPLTELKKKKEFLDGEKIMVFRKSEITRRENGKLVKKPAYHLTWDNGLGRSIVAFNDYKTKKNATNEAAASWALTGTPFKTINEYIKNVKETNKIY